MNFRLISIILMGILFGACRKDSSALFDGNNCADKCFTIYGKVTDSASNEGVPNAYVKFFHKRVSSNFLSDNTSYLGTTKTDPNGDYNFKFPGENIAKTSGYYYAEVFKRNMFVDPFYGNRFPAFYLDSSSFNIPTRQDFPLFRPATLIVRIIASQITNYQYLTINYSYGRIGHGVVLNGPGELDKTITFKTAGDIKTVVKCDMAGSGLFIAKSDSIVIESGKSSLIEFRF